MASQPGRAQEQQARLGANRHYLKPILEAAGDALAPFATECPDCAVLIELPAAPTEHVEDGCHGRRPSGPHLNDSNRVQQTNARVAG